MDDKLEATYLCVYYYVSITPRNSVVICYLIRFRDFQHKGKSSRQGKDCQQPSTAATANPKRLYNVSTSIYLSNTITAQQQPSFLLSRRR